MKNISTLVRFGAMVTVLAVGARSTCAGQAATSKEGAHQTTTAAAQQPEGPNGGRGKVLETMNSGGYTYVRVDMGGRGTWAAAPAFKVKVGDSVIVPPGAPMKNFTSETLKRTFDVVYFVSSVEIAGQGKGPAPAAAEGRGANTGAPKPVAAGVTGVEKAKGGKTVEEILTGQKALAGKSVEVRGRVVKFSSGIMNKNWIHLQDGSGKEGTNDLTVTTDAVVSVGDTVLVSGKVTTDKDFGFGYKYDVILEDAKVTKE